LSRQITESEEIALRFRHRYIVDLEKFAVDPVFCKKFSSRSLALGDLVLVMGKLQVLTAGMQVEGFAEILH